MNRKKRVAIITPTLAASNSGNWHTAARWTRFLRPRYAVDVDQQWNGTDADCLIALHARRSAASIADFSRAFPGRPVIVVLTGTDLYRDIDRDQPAQRSLELATHLVVLNELGPRRLPPRLRRQTTVVLQSAPGLKAGIRRKRSFDIAVVGHLRDEKDPRLVWEMMQELQSDLPIRVFHAGAALDPVLGRIAAKTARDHARYVWLGDVSRTRARHLMRDAHVLLHPSKMEGGAQVIIEAITAHTPVVASRIDGNAGLLGADYAGLFTPGDAAAAVRLVTRAAREPDFYARLRSACERRAHLFAPERERGAVNRLVDNCLDTRLRSKR